MVIIEVHKPKLVIVKPPVVPVDPHPSDARYIQLGSLQKHQCAICLCELRYDRYTNLDHDHKTGRARGFLCFSCNLKVGQYEKGVSRLDSQWQAWIAGYLNDPPARFI